MPESKKNILTIITPSLNCVRNISHTIISTSILRESIATHLVVDSDSTDGTLDICELYGLEVIYVPPGNMYSAINFGISKSHSDWITYINGDDILFPKAIMDALAFDSGFDVLYGDIDFIDNEGRFLYHWSSAKPVDFRGLFASGVMPFSQPGTILKRSLWEQLGGFNEEFKYSSDFDFFLRAFMSGAQFFKYGQSSLAAFRLHQTQISQTYREVMFCEVRTALIQSSLTVGNLEMMWAMARMRVRNIGSYIIRYLRYLHLRRV